MGRPFKKDEIQHILVEGGERLQHFAIGFVKVEGDEDDALLGGSGTLVTFSNRNAILTADHVLEALPKKGELGLILPEAGSSPRLHRIIFQADNLLKVRIARASKNHKGPDLGLLLLNDLDASHLINNNKIFYNLEKRRERMLSIPPALDSGPWFLVGMGAEWTQDSPPERGFTRVKVFRGISGGGVVTCERQDGPYDYLDFETKYNAAYEGPASFQGFSGGGLWQVQLNERDGQVEVAEVLLSGVAFYQSALVGDVRTIFCHGRRSIYEHICNALRKATIS